LRMFSGVGSKITGRRSPPQHQRDSGHPGFHVRRSQPVWVVHGDRMSELPSVVLRTADLRAAGLDDRVLRRDASLGTLVRLARGRFVGAEVWAALDDRQRYCLRIRETMQIQRARVVASHLSAAALWGFPALDGWPSTVEVTDAGLSRNSRSRSVVRRPGDIPPEDIVHIEGSRVTAADLTAVDVSLTSNFAGALMVFDHGLRIPLFTRERLALRLDARRHARRWSTARTALRLASPLAESPGESISRAAMHELGFPPPVLQETFADARGLIGRADFWWPESGIVGEFDGALKYLDPSYRNGRSADQVVLDEKKRADRLRALPQVRGLARWDYATARDPERLASVLLAAGLPRLNPRNRRKQPA
jgi:hypothetical protein